MGVIHGEKLPVHTVYVVLSGQYMESCVYSLIKYGAIQYHVCVCGLCIMRVQGCYARDMPDWAGTAQMHSGQQQSRKLVGVLVGLCLHWTSN